MSVNVVKNFSKSFDDTEISVEYIVIHHTAVSLEETLEIFDSEEQEVSAHLVIDTEGGVYEIVPCLDCNPKRAWHAGESKLVCGDEILERFNDFSIGIELVNLDGNIHKYPDKQIDVLITVIKDLQERYPSLSDPSRIIGHEEIAGFRGKIDPGKLFPWKKVREAVFG